MPSGEVFDFVVAGTGTGDEILDFARGIGTTRFT